MTTKQSIQNFEALAENDLRRDALSIAEAGYAAINIGNALRRKLHIANDTLHIAKVELSQRDTVYRLEDRRVFFVGVGKCAFAAAHAIEEILGDRLTAGIALDVSAHDQTSETKTIEAHVGTHPLPSEDNQRATERIIEFLSDCREDDLVIMLISGGGSTLLCSPEATMTCTDESAIFKELTARGAPIQDMNTVRKHLSGARGGGLARAAYPAEVIALIVSDIPGNDIAYISSGPTVADTSTIEDARAVFAKYEIAIPAAIAFLETPKEEKYFARVTNTLFLTNEDALAAMKNEAEERGYATEIVDEQVTGEARTMGRAITERLHDRVSKTALLYAGESTVTIEAQQKASGGRNQEMALGALVDIRDDELVVPFASDGHDNTDHAGAIADAVTRAHASTQNLSIEEYLDAHRSYDFFTTTQDALLTGYTGSNVSDLIVALKK